MSNDKYAIPVDTFIQQLLSEKFPDLNVKKGSAIYSTTIAPIIPLFQYLRDYQKVLKRNMSLQNYAFMSDAELNALASNYFITRRTGTRAYHVQRVFFPAIQMVNIPSSAYFFDDYNHRWFPLQSYLIQPTTLSNYIDPITGDYYVDIVVQAENTGDAYIALPNQVTHWSGISGVSRTVNYSRSSGGSNDESNSELYVRIKNSVTNRDLVSKPAIRATIMDNFASVRDVQVIGYGDAGMTRDMAGAVMSMDTLFQQSFCQKYNVPLNADGDVQWEDDDGNPIVTPAGGYAGVITDNLGKDYNNIKATFDGVTYQYLSVQPGMQLRLFTPMTSPTDVDTGDFMITKVEEIEPVYNGETVKVIRIDQAFSDTLRASAASSSSLFQMYPYTVIGPTMTKTFHTGAKVDCYIDSTSDTTDYVVITSLADVKYVYPNGITGAAGTYSINISDTVEPYYEGGRAFKLPVVVIEHVYVVDPSSADVIIEELIPGTNWFWTSSEAMNRFRNATTDVLTIKVDSDVASIYDGVRIRIDYITCPDVPLIQTYVDSANVRNTGFDIRIKTADIALLDVDLSFSSDSVSVTDAQNIISEFIRAKGMAAEITSYDVTTVLALFGVTDVVNPIRLIVQRQRPSGVVDTEVSEDRVRAGTNEKFVPITPLSVRKK